MKQKRNKRGHFLPRHGDKEISIISRGLEAISEAKALDFDTRNRIADYIIRYADDELRKPELGTGAKALKEV